MTRAEALPRVFVVDDEASIRASLAIALDGDFQVETFAHPDEVLAAIERNPPDAVLLDIMMPRMDGITLLAKIRAIRGDMVVVMLTALTSPNTVVEAMRRGADDYLAKPFDIAELKLVLDKAFERRSLRAEVRRLRSELADRFSFGRLVGRSKAMREMYDAMEQILDRKSTVIIRGESGTGKELVARAIHFSGPRRDKPFIVVNCAAIPDTLIESELFGHERGAFTDARERKLGHFEAANEGTIFLDEIGELALAMQSRLLRVLQEREFTRVGGIQSVKIDVRVITATNRDLEQAIEQGGFRRDLYYRINVIPLLLPALRERKEDIPLLADHFLVKHAEGRPLLKLAPATLDALVAYDWPGNVRELENCIERLTAMAPGDVALPDALPRVVLEGGRIERLRSDVLGGRKGFEQAVAEFERELLAEGLQRTASVQTRAAALLGVSRRILKYKMDKYGLT